MPRDRRSDEHDHNEKHETLLAFCQVENISHAMRIEWGPERLPRENLSFGADKNRIFRKPDRRVPDHNSCELAKDRRSTRPLCEQCLTWTA